MCLRVCQLVCLSVDHNSEPCKTAESIEILSERQSRSLARGHLPASFKAFITPTASKPGMDTTDVSSYRPISNLPVLSKLMKYFVVRQLMDYLQSSDLLPANQSGFRPGHSTETAVLWVLSDILLAVDREDVAALILLNISAAFDTVDYDILLQRLQTTYDISDVAHRWFRSYLLGRSQYVRIGTSCSSVIDLICDVPQGSVLGPVLFILYTAGLNSLIESHGLTPHLYADDTQVYGSCPAANVHAYSVELTVVVCDDETPAPAAEVSTACRQDPQ